MTSGGACVCDSHCAKDQAPQLGRDHQPIFLNAEILLTTTKVMADQAPSAPKQPFLRLPTELRLPIYELVSR